LFYCSVVLITERLKSWDQKKSPARGRAVITERGYYSCCSTKKTDLWSTPISVKRRDGVPSRLGP
jgi:hypothetical protein